VGGLPTGYALHLVSGVILEVSLHMFSNVKLADIAIHGKILSRPNKLSEDMTRFH